MEDKPFSIVDIIILTMLTAPLDVLDYVLQPIGLAILIAPFHFMVSIAIAVWLSMKRGLSSRLMGRLAIWLFALIINLIPFVAIVPAGIMAAIYTVWHGNHSSSDQD